MLKPADDGLVVPAYWTVEDAPQRCHFCSQKTKSKRCSGGGIQREDRMFDESNDAHPGIPSTPQLESGARFAAHRYVAPQFFPTLYQESGLLGIYEDAQRCFAQLSLAEELLLSRYRVCVTFRRAPYHHVKFRGHTIAYLQHTEELINEMPLWPGQLSIVIVKAQARFTVIR